MGHNEIPDRRRQWVQFKDGTTGKIIGYDYDVLPAGETVWRRYWWVLTETGQIVSCRFGRRSRKQRSGGRPKIIERPNTMRGIFASNKHTSTT